MVLSVAWSACHTFPTLFLWLGFLWGHASPIHSTWSWGLSIMESGRGASSLTGVGWWPKVLHCQVSPGTYRWRETVPFALGLLCREDVCLGLRQPTCLSRGVILWGWWGAERGRLRAGAGDRGLATLSQPLHEAGLGSVLPQLPKFHHLLFLFQWLCAGFVLCAVKTVWTSIIIL